MKAYISSLSQYIVWSTIVLAASVVLGVAITATHPEIALIAKQELAAVAEAILNREPSVVAALIFANNSITILLMIVLGVLAAVVPMVFLFLNGALLGMVLYLSAASDATARFVAGIVPHGVLELPALVLGAAIGIRLGIETVRRIRGVTDETVVTELGRALKAYAFVILPLLAAAAIIEAFVTPVVMNLVS